MQRPLLTYDLFGEIVSVELKQTSLRHSTRRKAQLKPHMTEEQTRDFLALVNELLVYEPASGLFWWRVNHHTNKAGERAGYVFHQGHVNYIAIRFQTQGGGWTWHYAHRLAWLITTGNWPVYEIDHQDHDGQNNRITNLRDVTHVRNLLNRRPRRKQRRRDLSAQELERQLSLVDPS